MKHITHLLIIFFALFFVSCGKNKKDQSCTEFEFKNFGTYASNWKSELTFKKVDSIFFKEKIKPIGDFAYSDPEDFFFVCEISKSHLEGDVIVKAIGPELEMYFIAGNVKPFLLACLKVSPAYYRVTKSKLVENTLEMKTIYVNFEKSVSERDSIKSRFEIEKLNVFERVEYDSVRISNQ
jgi:hypothetical protein